MLPDSPKHLEDIRDAAAFILEVSRDLSLESYLENRLVRQPVERNFEIIEEALNRISRIDSETAAFSHHRIPEATRDRGT